MELDANEPPIADGSAREYCKLIQQVGVVQQSERREPYKVTAPIELIQGETTMAILASVRTKKPEMGYATDFVDIAMKAVLPVVMQRGIKVVANAGGVICAICALDQI